MPAETRPKAIRAFDRVPVVAQAVRLLGHTVWKKATARKHGTSKEKEEEVLRESVANGEGARKRFKDAGIRNNIQDATWASQPTGSLLHFKDSPHPTHHNSENTTPTIEEVNSTFPNTHYIPRKRTHTDQIITPQKAERITKTDLTEEAKRLLIPDFIPGSAETPARRTKSARMSMANRRVTLGGPDLGLDLPFRATPSKNTPSKATPVKIFQSAGGGSADGRNAAFGANTAARSARKSSLGGTNELATPSKEPLRRSLRSSTIGSQNLLGPVLNKTSIASNNPANKKPVHSGNDESNNLKGSAAEGGIPASHSGGALTKKTFLSHAKVELAKTKDASPKRKRNPSPNPTRRKSSRLSVQSQTSKSNPTPNQDLSDEKQQFHRNADADVHSQSKNISNDWRENTSSVVNGNEDVAEEVVDSFKSSQSKYEEGEDDEETRVNIPRPPTRRPSRGSFQEPQNSNSKESILISIKSAHMANIRSGLKTHEFRGYKLPDDITYLWLYETAPKKCITHIARIGQAQVPGEIHNRGLGNPDFNAIRDNSLYAYELLQLYELCNELPLHTLLEKQYAKGPPQKYSFACQKLLNEVSLAEDTNIIFDMESDNSIVHTGEAISVPQLAGTSESVELFSPNRNTVTGEEDEDIWLSLSPKKPDSVESAEDANTPNHDLSPEQKASSRLRSLSPEFEDLLSLGAENTPRLLSPKKDEENKLSRLSPIQLGNYLLEELEEDEACASPQDAAKEFQSSSGSEPTETAAANVTDNLNSAPPITPHDDTVMLEDFITRVRANRAANTRDPAKSTSRLQSPVRNPLSKVSTNHSPKPSSSEAEERATKTAGTPSPLKPSLKPTKSEIPISPPVLPEGDEQPIRRSGRSRTPLKGVATTSLPLPVSAPSSIPLRPLTAFALKQKADKKLAVMTRNNTLRNCGPYQVREFLELQAEGVVPDIDAATGTIAVVKPKKYSKKKSPTTKNVPEETIEEPAPSIKKPPGRHKCCICGCSRSQIRN